MSSTQRRDLTDDDLGRLLRSVTVADGHLETPPPAIWAAIEAELADGARDTATGGSTAVTSLADRRRGPGRVAGWTLGVAAALIVGVLGGFLLADREGSEPAQVATVDEDVEPLGTTELAFAEGEDGFDPLGADASASAVVVSDGSTRFLRLDDASLPDVDDAFLELWLLDTGGDELGLVSLGTVEGADEWAIPEDVDLGAYSVVDISIEPVDGDPGHSGRSILRGELGTA